MPSNWTDPKTWGTGELVTQADMNTYIRDNLLYLKNANNITYVEADNNYSTTSATWADIDTSNLSLSVTTNGGLLVLGMQATARIHTSENTKAMRTVGLFDITRDGTRMGGTHGLYAFHPPNDDYLNTSHIPMPAQFQVVLPALSAGTYTFRLQWRYYEITPDGIKSVYLMNTASGGTPVLFYAMEVAV